MNTIDEIFGNEPKIYRFLYADKQLTEKLILENDEEGYFKDYKEQSDDEVKWLPLTKQNVLELVPKGDYCYGGFNDTYKCCPFWNTFNQFPRQMNGYCSLLEVGDFMRAGYNGTSLLWDQIKECSINPADERDYFSSDEEYQKFLQKTK